MYKTLLRINDEHAKRLKEIAKAQGVSLNALICRILREFLEKTLT